MAAAVFGGGRHSCHLGGSRDEHNRGLFILDYLMIMVLFAIIGLLITMGLANISRKGKRT